MALYEYNDSFLVDSVDSDELDSVENKAIQEVEKIGITDEFYKEKAVISKVYITLATLQLDNDGEGTKDKLRAYTNDFKHYINLAKTNSSTSNISTIPIARG